jgi:hypothetical protein
MRRFAQPAHAIGWAVTSPTPHRFDWPSWELGDVFGWILDREPEQFGRIFTEEDLRSASYIAVLYRCAKGEPSARTVLLHALQRGELIARDRNGTRVDPDFWLPKSEADLPRLGRAFLFRREEVLRLWPQEAGENSLSSGQQSKPPTGFRTTKEAGAEAACVEWLGRLSAPPGNKETTFSAARTAVADFGCLARKAFDRAWAQAAPAEWKRPGRRRSTENPSAGNQNRSTIS